MSNNKAFKEVMKILKEEKKQYDKEQRALKREESRLTKAVKKAGHQSPNSLDSFSEENMYYSPKETQDYLAGSSYMDTYNATKNDWDY